MRLTQEHPTQHTPESLVRLLHRLPGVVLLRSGIFEGRQARYSFVAARPFISFRSFGGRCETRTDQGLHVHFGNPWDQIDALMARYELLHDLDLPFPAGGCFGFWGYDLKNFVEPKLSHRTVNDLDLPDCHLGFYDSIVAFDHQLGKSWIIATGLDLDGSRTASLARKQTAFWQERLDSSAAVSSQESNRQTLSMAIKSNLNHSEFIERVNAAKSYIQQGDIYQVNLSHRFLVKSPIDSWTLFERLTSVSPAPFSAYLGCGRFQIVSSSPELFLRLSGRHIQTRPIKGTRPRSADPVRDAQLTYELQTSPKEMAELVMITDLLRNDLGKICQFGSVNVPELVRLERYAHVQHLVSTVEGQLRPRLTHLAALAACFPGGSVTGAPKFRAMEIIDELEPVRRGPYTGALGYLGFNQESQLSVVIRTAVCTKKVTCFHSGAGIVADSDPESEYAETFAKARGFFEALGSRTFALSPSLENS
jgi:para-aminobenzoate synthetase component I